MNPLIQKSRNGKIELLRVLSMVMVLVLHYLYDNLGGVLGKLTLADGINYYISWLLEAFCYVAVNVFVLISGYFLATSKSFKWGKVVTLVAQCWVYSVGIYLLACLCGVVDFYFPTLVTAYFLPLISGKWWFVACYLALYLLSPFLNAWHNALDKRQHFNLLILLGSIFVLIPTLIFWTGNTIGVNGGYCLIWFIFLYLLSAYIRKYANTWPDKIPWGQIYLVSCCITFVGFVGQKSVLKSCYWNWYKYNSLTNVISSIALFMFFLQWGKRSGESKIDGLWRTLGKGTLGVFLIHTHFILASILLWRKWVKADIACKHGSLYFLGHLLLWVLLIFVICEGIDLLRGVLFDKIARLIKHYIKSPNIQKEG